MKRVIGVLTAGGDTPGLNAAIRAIGKSAINNHDMNVIGFLDGFRGMVQNRFVRLDSQKLSGILTIGGTILGTSRDKPHKMLFGPQIIDMRDVIVENYHRNHLDALICLGGGGTAKNAYRLKEKGLNIITLPKTIDNDIARTDTTFGFDTALGIATDAIDRLHSTAHSHHRIIVVEIMGHNAGWLTLGAGIAGGADVVLIPEMPYSTEHVAEAIKKRAADGKRFSIVAVSEGAMPEHIHKRFVSNEVALDLTEDKRERQRLKEELAAVEEERENSTHKLTLQLEEMTGLESRVTILGHVQRGGIPSPMDRLLASRLGTAAVEMVVNDQFGVMVAVRGNGVEPVPLKEVINKRKTVPLDHPWVEAARSLKTSLGD